MEPEEEQQKNQQQSGGGFDSIIDSINGVGNPLGNAGPRLPGQSRISPFGNAGRQAGGQTTRAAGQIGKALANVARQLAIKAATALAAVGWEVWAIVGAVLLVIIIVFLIVNYTGKDHSGQQTTSLLLTMFPVGRGWA
jgi:hypothetical protein